MKQLFIDDDNLIRELYTSKMCSVFISKGYNMTNKEMFALVSDVLTNAKADAALIEKFNDFKDVQLGKLERDAERRAEKVAKSHTAIVELILKGDFNGKTATEIATALKNDYDAIKDEDEKSLSTQKVASVVKGMIADGKASKEKSGKKVTYTFSK